MKEKTQSNEVRLEFDMVLEEVRERRVLDISEAFFRKGWILRKVFEENPKSEVVRACWDRFPDTMTVVDLERFLAETSSLHEEEEGEEVKVLVVRSSLGDCVVYNRLPLREVSELRERAKFLKTELLKSLRTENRERHAHVSERN